MNLLRKSFSGGAAVTQGLGGARALSGTKVDPFPCDRNLLGPYRADYSRGIAAHLGSEPCVIEHEAASSDYYGDIDQRLSLIHI